MRSILFWCGYTAFVQPNNTISNKDEVSQLWFNMNRKIIGELLVFNRFIEIQILVFLLQIDQLKVVIRLNYI